MKRKFVLIAIFLACFFSSRAIPDLKAATATLPVNSLIFWTGANASIPTGFSRVTAFDGKFLQGLDSTFTASANAGSTSHQNTFSAHNHATVAHNHTASAGRESNVVAQTFQSGSTNAVQAGTRHTHASITSSSATFNFNNATTTLDAATTTAEPTHKELIIITPDDGNQTIPDDCVVFQDTNSVPSGFNNADGTGGAINLELHYVKGASTGEDADLTTKGSSTHFHTQSGTGHKHTAPSHDHADFTSGASVNSITAGTADEVVVVIEQRHHTLNFAATTAPDTALDDGNVSTESNSPLSRFVFAVQNISGSSQVVSTNTIVGFTDSYANIPRSDGWYLSDGKDHSNSFDISNRWIRHTDEIGGDFQIGVEHGEDEHNHFYAHGHTDVVGHIHTLASVNITGAYSPNSGSGKGENADSHTHTWTIGAAGNDAVSANQFSADADIRHPYRTMLWIKFIGPPTVHILGNTLIKGTTLILNVMMFLCVTLLSPIKLPF